MTAEELLAVQDITGRHELIAGELIELSFGGMARGLATANIGFRLGDYVEREGLGQTLMSAGFQLAWNPDTVLGAALAFVAKQRIVDTWGYYPGAPDLAIEVVNFDETCAGMERRADEWIAAGTRMVIVVDPKTKTVITVTPDGKTRLTATDIVTGGDVVPGWSLAVREIFK